MGCLSHPSVLYNVCRMPLHGLHMVCLHVTPSVYRRSSTGCQSRQWLSSSSNLDFIVPRRVIGTSPTIWNSLPESVRSTKTLPSRGVYPPPTAMTQPFPPRLPPLRSPPLSSPPLPSPPLSRGSGGMTRGKIFWNYRCS